MTDLERVELAARRTAANFRAANRDIGEILDNFADEIFKLYKEKEKS